MSQGVGEDVGIVRSIRLPRKLDEELRKEAEEKGVSFNTLIVNVLRKHVEWDRFSERFGHVSIAAQEYGELIGRIDQASLREIAAGVGRRALHAATLFWFKDLSASSLLHYFKLQCRYGRIAQCELTHRDGKFTLSLHHPFSVNHSLYLAELLRSSLESIAEEPEITITDHSLAAKIRTENP